MADYVFTHASNTAFTTRVTLTNAGVGVVNWSATFIRSSTAWKSFNVNTSTNRPEFNFALGGVGFSGFYTYNFQDGSGQGLERAMGSGSISVPSGSNLTLTGTNNPRGSMGIATVPAGQTFTTQSPPPPPTPVWSTGTTLAVATRGTAYLATVTASPVTSYSVVSQSADTRGLSASENVIFGIPTSTGTVTFTIRANNSGSTADRTFSITINPALPVFSDSSVATAVRNSSYADGVTASETASYSLRNPENTGAGNLPSGLSLNTSTGAITGTPSTVGSTQFRVRATNVTGFTDTGIITLTVNPVIPEFIDSTVAADAIVGTAYSDGVAATETASYSVFSGSLPPGITLNTTTGEITSSPGTPTTAGIFTFVIRATNATGSTNTETLTITVISGAKVWNGTDFVAGTTKVWDGTAFVSSTTRVWNGSAWVSST
jgi:hypothetical protein